MEEQGDLYFTLLYGILNTQTHEFRYVSAGHDPPVHLPHGAAPQLLPSQGFPIGWVDGAEYEERQVQLSPGDRVFLYSDGVPEAMDEQLNEFGEERMIDVITQSRSEPMEQSVSQLCEAVQLWCRTNGPRDDVSILAFEIPSSGGR